MPITLPAQNSTANPAANASSAIAAVVPTPGEFNLYVATSALGGRDTNPGTSLAAPLATFAKAAELLALRYPSKRITENVIVNFGLGSFAGLDVSSWFFAPASQAVGASLLIKGTLKDVTPTTGTATGTFTSSTTGSTTGGVTHTVLTDSGAAWTVDDFKGKLLVRGTTVLPVVSNTATTITVCSNSALAAGTYAVQEPGSVCNSVVSQQPAIGSTTVNSAVAIFANNYAMNRNIPVIRAQNMKFTASAGLTSSGMLVQSGTARVDFTNCELSFTQNGVGCLLAMLPGGVSFVGSVVHNTGSATQITFGLGSGQGIPNGTFTNTFFHGAGTGFTFGSNQPTGTNWTACTIDRPSGGGVDVDSGRHILLTTKITTSGTSLRSTLSGITRLGGPTAVSLQDCQLNSAGAGIELTGPSFLNATNLAGTCVTAVNVSAGARVKISANSAINGTTQDILVDGTARDLDSDMRAASPKLVSSTYFSIVHE